LSYIGLLRSRTVLLIFSLQLNT